MSENKMVRFVWATVLVAGLLFITGFFSECFMGCLLCGAALIVVFQIQSISDEQSRSSLVMQGIFSLLFSLFAGHFAAYLIFYELRMMIGAGGAQEDEETERHSENRSGKFSCLRVFLPGLCCFFCTILCRMIMGESTEVLPYLLWHVLLLTICTSVFYGLETALTHYLRIQRESAVAVRSAAINELFEKKLNHELRMKNYLAERNARLEERENISRNIHNSVGHTITAAVMTLDAAEMLMDVDAGKAKEHMLTAKDRMKDGLSAIRLAVRVLDKESRGVQMEDFLRELSSVTENFMMDTERKVQTDVDITADMTELPKVHTEFLTGAVQELLTNGVKHGNATRFLLSIRGDSAHLQVSVRDNGKSDFSEINMEKRLKDGFGLKKIVSYLKRCGGEARFTNENGFCAMFTVPLVREETDGDV